MLFWGLLGVCLAVRGTAWARTHLVSTDGVNFYYMAQEFSRGEWANALAQDQHPLYPAAIGLIHVLGVPPTASLAVSMILWSAVLFILLWRLVGVLFGASTAAWAGWLFAVHPLFAVNAADSLSETPALALMAAALFVLARWRQVPSWRLELVLGGLSGLGYLVRQDAVEVLLGAMVLLGWGVARGTLPSARAGRCLVLAGLGFAVIVFPYLFYLRLEEGRWMISRKKDLAALFPWLSPDYGEHPEVPLLGVADPLLAVRLWIHRWDFWYTWQKQVIGAFHPFVLLAAGVGAFWRRPRDVTPRHRSSLFLGVFFWLHIAVLLVLLSGSGYLEKRHVLFAVLVALPWAAMAFERVRASAIVALMAIASAAVLLPQALKTRRDDAEGRLVYRELGWGAARAALPAGAIAGPRGRQGQWITFYAATRGRRDMLFYDVAGGRLELTPQILARSAGVLCSPAAAVRYEKLLASWRPAATLHVPTPGRAPGEGEREEIWVLYSRPEAY